MVRQASLFSQLVALFHRGQFFNLVFRHQAERCAKGFSSWDHFVAMLFCQLAQAKSLREICGGLSCCLGKAPPPGRQEGPQQIHLVVCQCPSPLAIVSRPVLPDAGHLQDGRAGQTSLPFQKQAPVAGQFHHLALPVVVPVGQISPNQGVPSNSTCCWIMTAICPTFAHITNGKKHDVTIARRIPLSPYSIVAMDRGYNDYQLFAYWTENRIFFVTRLKDNADYSVVEKRSIPTNRNILADELIRFNGYYARKGCPNILRKVVVWDKNQNREIVLLTNHLEFGPTTISAIYKDRWQIELFFKALKQNLKVKTFVGTTENALFIQIWTALIAMLLIKYLSFKAKFGWSLSNLVAFLRWNLFTYRDLWEWIDHPFDVLPITPESVQNLLPFKGLGQH